MYSSLISFHSFLPSTLARCSLARHCCGSRHKTFNFTPFAIEQTSAAAQDIPTQLHMTHLRFFELVCRLNAINLWAQTILLPFNFSFGLKLNAWKMHSSQLRMCICANCSSSRIDGRFVRMHEANTAFDAARQSMPCQRSVLRTSFQ